MMALADLAAAVTRLGGPASVETTRGEVRSRLQLAGRSLELRWLPDPEDGDLLLLAPDFLTLPPDLDPAVAGRLARLALAANWELALACFELDPAGRRLRLRLTLPLAGAEPTAAQLERCLAAIGFAAERYEPACRQVLGGLADVAQALAELPPIRPSR
jgi:hypothetical protein